MEQTYSIHIKFHKLGTNIFSLLQISLDLALTRPSSEVVHLESDVILQSRAISL